MTNSSAWAGTIETVHYNVYLGVWINWSRGRIMGATLTLDRVYGNLLIAFTAIFVGIVATATWRVSCLCFHRIYSTSAPRDALHHQRQAILRNSSSAASAFWTMSKLSWTWRRNTKELLARTLPALALSGLCFCLFTVAGGFSSSISSGVGNEVLLDGQGCGIVYTGTPSPETVSTQKAYISQTINNAVNYAQACYSNSSIGVFDCTSFVKDHLPGTVDDQAACPFDDGMCRDTGSNLLLDSGYLDSREHLGVNTPDSDKIFFRTTLHCAPLNTAGFSENVSTAANNYTQYFYGPAVENLTFTWQTEDMNAQYLRTQDNKLHPLAAQLGLSVMYANTANRTVRDVYSMFAPDRRLFRPDADLYLIFLSGNGVAFYEPTNDPWYRGSVPWATVHNAGYNDPEQWNITVYRPDEAASPMGCIQQYQYCNADHQCGELASFVDAMATAAPFLDTPLEAIWGNANTTGQTSSQFSWFESILYSSYDLAEVLGDLGTASLASIKNFNSGYLAQIPDDQWKQDVTHWWATLLAAKQAAFVNAAQGPADPAILRYTTPPRNEYMESLCRNQKILSTDYTSFSLFGLYFTFTVGVLIILVSYLLEPLFACLVRRRKYEEYKYLEWTGNETLQLQRMAYQGLGSESWSGYTDSIPKTRPGYFLPDLLVEYPVHGGKSEAGQAVKRGAETLNASIIQSHANPNADQPRLVAGTDGKRSITNVQISPVSTRSGSTAVVSPTGSSRGGDLPETRSSEPFAVDAISPTSQEVAAKRI